MLKTNWQTKKLSDVTFFQEGPGIRKYEYKKNGYPIINVRCVQDGFIDLSNAQAVDPKFIKEKWSHFQVEEGDILFTTSGTIGRTAMAKKNDLPLLMNTSVVRFKSLNEKELDRYFLAWLLRSPKFIEEVKSYSSGTAQKNVGPTHLKLISISYPLLSEQKRIVKILDEAFEKIEKAKENAEKNLKNSKEIFESYLQNVFANPGKDWEEKKLGDVLLKTKTIDPTKKSDEEFIYLDVSSVNKETKEIVNVTRVMGKNAPSRARKLIRTNDIIFATVRPTHSRVALITEEYDGQVCSTGYFVLRAKDFLNTNLVFYFLLTHGFNKQMEKLQKGASYPAVTDSEVRGIFISYPKSISEQKAIVKKLDSLSEQTKKLEGVYKQKLADLEELKKSILNKAFSGEL